MEQIWWERVPNALAFTSDIIESLVSEKSMILNCPGGLPWHFYMSEFIRESVKQRNSSKRFESVPDISDPGEYLLREFCKPEKRADYRPTKTYAKFFAESDDIVLHERYLWVKINSKEQLERWSEFVSEYVRERGKNVDTAVFILEWTGGGNIRAKKSVKVFSFDDYVSEYDRVVFCTLAASSVKERPFIKNYLTELAAIIVDQDIELCAACLENYERFLEDPYAAIEKVVSDKTRSNGNGFSFGKKKTDVEHLTWLAQIKTVYPALEEYREDFVQRYHSAIQRQLPITSSYGEVYSNPRDVELGTLKYMADSGGLNLSLKEHERLKVNKDARNKLSHLTPLSLEEIKKLE